MKNNVKSVTKDSIFYSISNMMNKVVGFILLPLYSSYFSISEYGILALFDTIIDFMNIFTAFGIVEAFKRWFWEDDSKEKQKRVFSTTFTFSLITSILFSFILYLILKHFSMSIFGCHFSNSFILIYIISIIANSMMQRIFILLRTQRLAKLNMLYNVLRMIVTCIATVLLIIHFKMGMESIFIGRILGILVTFIPLIPHLAKMLTFKIDYGLLKQMLKFSYPLAISSSMSLVFTLSDRWLLKGLSNLESVGQYSLAYRITNLIKFIVINSFLQAYVYNFYQKMHNPESYALAKKVVTYFSLVIILAGVVMTCYSKEIILILTDNPQYYNSYKIIPFLFVAILFSGLRQILVLPFYKYKQSKFISKMSILAGIINIALNLLFIPIWGAYGAAIATAFAHIFIVTGFFYKGRKFKEYSYEIGKFGLIFFSGLIYIIALSYLNNFSFWIGLLSKTVLLITYPVVLFLIGLFNKKEISMIANLIKYGNLRKKNL